MLTASHNPADVQRHQAVPARSPPDRRDSGLERDAPSSPRRRWRVRRPTAGVAAVGRRRAGGTPRPAHRVRRTRAVVRRRRGSASARRSSPTPPTGWEASSSRGLRRPAVRARDPLPGPGRLLPEPPRRPDPAREPRRPASPRSCLTNADVGLGVRRRRGPGLPRRRARRAAVRIADDGHRRRGHAGAASRFEDPLQPDLLASGARGHRRARRRRRSGPVSATRSSRP